MKGRPHSAPSTRVNVEDILVLNIERNPPKRRRPAQGAGWGGTSRPPASPALRGLKRLWPCAPVQGPGSGTGDPYSHPHAARRPRSKC